MSDILSSLTPRQAEVLSLIAEGFCNKEISKKLGVSDSATDCHITNVLEKLKVNNRTKAAAIYFKAQLKQANTKIDRLCETLLEAADKILNVYNGGKRGRQETHDKYINLVKEIKDNK